MTSTSSFGYIPKYEGNSVATGFIVQKANVTQITSVNTAVVANGSAGIITTFAQSAAANGEDTFTLTNSAIKAESVVLAQVVDYAGTFSTNGLPSVAVDTIADGSCSITVLNPSTAALSGVAKIAFQVL